MDAAALGERVNLLGPWLRRRLGRPVVKIGLDAGLGCPHRPARTGAGGCSFCPPNASGRGEGRGDVAGQLARGLAKLQARRRPGRPLPAVLAYFQAFSSTFAPPEVLRRLYDQALADPRVAGLIVSTRPDCLDPPRWEVLDKFQGRTLFWLELGLQSAHDATLRRINRGHDRACFDQAVAEAQRRGIRVVAHVILGLPGEGLEQTNATARHLASLGVWGVKLHNLMVLEGAALAAQWRRGGFRPWGRERWARAAGEFLARLPGEVLIHRLAADPGPDRLLAPRWAADKDRALSALLEYLRAHDLRQGELA